LSVENIEIDTILTRFKFATGLKNDRDIADLIGISPQNFNNRKKRGTLLSPILEWAAKEKINTSWILTGEGEMLTARAGESTSLNLQLVRDVVSAVAEHLQKEETELDPDTLADLVVTLYEEFSETEDKKVNKRTVARMIKLAR